ncbi:MAG TPA: 2-hydroxyacid dehydrogenase [Actinopolymorphaceae bacterium]
MTTILAAGDEFVRTDLLVRALRERLDPATGPYDIRELSFDWPTTPWSDVAEVSEAAGGERAEETMIRALAGVRAAVTHLAPFTARVLENAPELELVVVSRGGPVNVNLDAATAAGVVVCFAPGRNAQAAAEFTIGLMLAACRNIGNGHHELMGGTWPGHYFRFDNAGSELNGSTIGLVGYGAIGHLVGRIVTAFGAHVLVYDPYADPSGLDPAVERVDDLTDLLRRSRIVSLHARQTEETTGMIGAAELAAMPQGAVLVNSARGGLLDHIALCDALDSGHLGAAALDVYPHEPLSLDGADARLRRTPNLVLTPHIAGCSREVAIRAAGICADEVARWTRGEPPAHCANPGVLAPR